jgi:hypothetical protein
MIIQLKGNLDPELTRIGLKPGDKINGASRDTFGKTGAVYFDRIYGGVYCTCVVWPENYDVIKEDKPEKPVQFTIT